MIIYENECVSCDTCMGSHCPNRRVSHAVCDECGTPDTETDFIFAYDGDHLCTDCLLTRLLEDGVIEAVVRP